jgi:AcrR family transcriptional regulator
MQRSRLLAAATATVEEVGWARASVAHFADRARVSRRTFYDLFANREECLVAVLDDALERVIAELGNAGLDGLPWRERVRRGLWVILSFLDREPVLARVCVVQSARGSEMVLERRSEIFARLAGVIEEGREDSPRARELPPLVEEGLVGAAHTIVYARLSHPDHDQPLTGLLGALMGLIVLPYLGPAAARREQSRSLPTPTKGSIARGADGTLATVSDPWQELPIRLTYRTALVLEAIAAHPGISNRRVGEHAGITDQGQVSKLLSRLERAGLLTNTGKGQTTGSPNAWRLTPTGAQTTHSITTHGHTNETVAS